MDTIFTTTTDPLALSISGAPPGSGLADINNNNDNSNGTTNSAPPSSGNIDFTYSDTDVQLKELAELYSYNEELDFTANRTSFEELMEDYGYSLKWTQALPGQRAQVVERLAAGLKLTEGATRVRAIRALLYLAQGNFADCQTVEEQPRFARANIFTLYEFGLFPLLVQLVHFEVGEALKLSDGQPPPPAPIPTSSGQSGSIITSLDAPNDNATSSLKLLLTIVYLFVLEMGRPVEEEEEEEAQHKQQLRDRSKEELMQPIAGKLLHLTLLELVIKQCQNTGVGARFPMKKILLLQWKTLLLTLGGSEHLRTLKDRYRLRAGLKAVPDDSLLVTRRLRPASPPSPHYQTSIP